MPLAATWMARETVTLNALRKANIIIPLNAESKKNNKNELLYKTETDS